MTDNPEQIPVTSGSRNASSNTHTNNRSGNSSRQTRLQRNLTDVNNSDRDFTGAVEELGVLGTVLEKYLKHIIIFIHTTIMINMIPIQSLNFMCRKHIRHAVWIIINI